jgi:hypothetical protein
MTQQIAILAYDGVGLEKWECIQQSCHRIVLRGRGLQCDALDEQKVREEAHGFTLEDVADAINTLSRDTNVGGMQSLGHIGTASLQMWIGTLPGCFFFWKKRGGPTLCNSRIFVSYFLIFLLLLESIAHPSAIVIAGRININLVAPRPSSVRPGGGQCLLRRRAEALQVAHLFKPVNGETKTTFNATTTLERRRKNTQI